jgi:hypothetical protein
LDHSRRKTEDPDFELTLTTSKGQESATFSHPEKRSMQNLWDSRRHPFVVMAQHTCPPKEGRASEIRERATVSCPGK